MTTPNLDRLFLESVDEAFRDLLGEDVRRAFFSYLENERSLKRDEIPGNLGDFSAGLEKAAGLASRVIRKAIIKKMYAKLGLNFTFKTSYGLEDYLADAKLGLSQDPRV